MAPRAPADRFLFHAFLALLLWMPLPFGSNVAWASSFMEAWVFLIAGLWLVQYYRGKVSPSRPFVRAWPVTACLLATLLWILVQAQALIVGGVFQAAYGSLMTLAGLEHGVFIDRQDPGVATGTFINRNHLAGYLEMCLAAGVGLMLAELSSTRAVGWRDSARQLLRT